MASEKRPAQKHAPAEHVPEGDTVETVVAAELVGIDRESVVLFLIESVKDSQGTIRAIDTKVSILLAALSIPIKDVADTISGWHTAGFHVGIESTFKVLAIVAYVLAVYVSVRTLSGLGNSAPHVVGSGSHNMFYAGGLYPFSFMDAFVGRTSIQSKRTLQQYIHSMPGDHHAVVTELTSEIMSLAFIRDLKLYRQRISYLLSLIAGVLAVLALLL